MPQMAPLNWLLLFMLFILIFMIFNSLNYFSFYYSTKISKFMKTSSQLNWKW
uniref:ATP synthase F0 subunit 8 n=1 Tax=Ochthephilus sericinus TaxID=3078930 RepID=UPI002A8093C7|nr:ATP synthase F0 subunit 8 [Ochthephilus sericinus]WON66007.1 ATP synthase F0 subunit 8 [Ochthephilus sericinus]